MLGRKNLSLNRKPFHVSLKPSQFNVCWALLQCVIISPHPARIQDRKLKSVFLQTDFVCSIVSDGGGSGGTTREGKHHLDPNCESGECAFKDTQSREEFTFQKPHSGGEISQRCTCDEKDQTNQRQRSTFQDQPKPVTV